NVLAVELHQANATTNGGLRLLPANGYAVTWDGREGDFFSAEPNPLAPTNAARAALGVDIFASSNTNQASNLNDGRYGSSSSWIPAPNDGSPFVILRFNQIIPLNSIAWGRDNGDTNEAACGGTCLDRSLGNYTIQYTLASDPAVVVLSSIDPSNAWTTVATVQYLSAQSGFTPSLRHRFDFRANDGHPLLATGVRFRPSVSNTIDEIEINPPTVATFDAAFGLELNSIEILPPPPSLAFNEVSAASGNNFWLEIINYGN